MPLWAQHEKKVMNIVSILFEGHKGQNGTTQSPLAYKMINLNTISYNCENVVSIGGKKVPFASFV